jgi:hypothetical protein
VVAVAAAAVVGVVARGLGGYAVMGVALWAIKALVLPLGAKVACNAVGFAAYYSIQNRYIPFKIFIFLGGHG